MKTLPFFMCVESRNSMCFREIRVRLGGARLHAVLLAAVAVSLFTTFGSRPVHASSDSGASISDELEARDPLRSLKQRLRSLGDPPRRSAIFSFHETFRDTLVRDPERFSSRESWDASFPAAHWDTAFVAMTNDDGTLAWKVSREAVALNEMFDVTGDAEYLERAWDFAVRAMQLRDDQTGLEDFSGEARPAWSSTRYGSGRRTSFLVHSGLILQPILETLAYLEGVLVPVVSSGATVQAGSSPGDAERRPVLAAATPDARRELLEKCLDTLRSYDDMFVSGPLENEGHYVHPVAAAHETRKAQPYNRVLVVAWDLWLAGKLSGDSSLVERSAQLSRFFQRRVQRQGEGALAWAYEPSYPDPVPRDQMLNCDDVSHAYYTIEPVVKLARAGVVFDEEDLGGFAKTVTQGFYDAEFESFYTSICGRKGFFNAAIGNLPGWLCLAETDPEVHAVLEPFLRRFVEKPSPLHLAYLVRYVRQPE